MKPMKRQSISNLKVRAVSLALCVAGCAAFGQGGGGPWGGPGGGPPPRPPLPPVIKALDTNGDHVIDATEIANAPQSLMKLLKSGSTSLAIADLLGPRRGHGPHGRPPGPPPDLSGTDMQLANPDSQNEPPPPPPDDQGGPAMSGTNQDGPPPGGDGGRPHRPVPPVIRALDTNKDGVIEANEIANATQALQTLLKSGSTSLSIPDLLGPPPHRRGPGGPGDDGPPPPPPDDQGPPPEESGTNGGQ